MKKRKERDTKKNANRNSKARKRKEKDVKERLDRTKYKGQGDCAGELADVAQRLRSSH